MKSQPPVSHEAVVHWIRFGIGREASPAARAWFQEAMKPAPCFRNEFSLDKKPERATLYVAALGYSEWFLNGKRIGDRVLDPAYQEYDRQIYYVAYDVTEDLRAGKNALGAVLGNGWFNQRGQFFGTAKSKFYTYGQDLGNPGIRVQLVLQHGNQTEHVVSDASWRCAYGPLLRNELFLGEVYDARLEHTGWNEARFDDRNWAPVETAAPPPARLKAMTCAPERRVREIPVISIAEPAPGIYVADLGETIAGWPKIRVREKSGTVIAVRPSPFLRNRPEFMAGRALPYPDPALDRKIISNMIGGELTAQPPDVDGKERSQFHGCDLYITRGGGEETFERHFSYCGFRYVELIGLTHRPGPQDILGVVVHSDLPRTATFRCSDEKVNELYASMEKTLRYVTHGLVNDNTDAEKNAMRGHQAMAGDFLAYAWNDPMFWEKAIHDIRLQTVGEGDLEGLPPTKAPAPRYFHRGGGGLRPYVDTIYEAVRALRFTDNRALAEEHFPWMMKFLRLFHRRVIDPRLLRTTQELGGGGLYVAGDRLDVCRVEPRPHFADAASSRPEVVERCLFLLAVQETREVAQVLGKHAEQKELEDMAGRISETIRNLGYDGNLKTFGSQAENAMALRTGVVPPPDRRAVAGNLKRIIKEEWDGHLSVGFIGTRYLLSVLSEYGEADVAHHLWNVNTWPSWRWLLENGLDTANSYWNHFDKPGKLPVARFIQSEKPVAASWVYESLCGLRPDPQYPGWKRIILAPAPPSNMAWTEAELLTVRGRIQCRWVREGGKMTYRFTLPANTLATVLLPHGTPLQGFGPGLKNLGIEEAPIGMVNRIEALAGSYTLYE